MNFLVRFLVCVGLTFFATFVVTFATPEMAGIRLPLIILFSAPIWVAAFSRYLLEFAVGVIGAVRHAAYASDHGRHYAFGGVPLHYELLDGAVWFPASDVERLLASPITAKEKRSLGPNYAKGSRGFRWLISETGVLHLLRVRTGARDCPRQVLKLRQWFENETLPSIKRHHET